MSEPGVNTYRQSDVLPVVAVSKVGIISTPNYPI